MDRLWLPGGAGGVDRTQATLQTCVRRDAGTVVMQAILGANGTVLAPLPYPQGQVNGLSLKNLSTCSNHLLYQIDGPPGRTRHDQRRVHTFTAQFRQCFKDTRTFQHLDPGAYSCQRFPPPQGRRKKFFDLFPPYTRVRERPP